MRWTGLSFVLWSCVGVRSAAAQGLFDPPSAVFQCGERGIPEASNSRPILYFSDSSAAGKRSVTASFDSLSRVREVVIQTEALIAAVVRTQIFIADFSRSAKAIVGLLEVKSGTDEPLPPPPAFLTDSLPPGMRRATDAEVQQAQTLAIVVEAKCKR